MERTDFDQWKAREVARLLGLVESERRYYQEMVARLPVPLVLVSADRSAVTANRAFRRAFQIHGEDLRVQVLERILTLPGLAARIQEAQAQNAPAPPLLARWGERTLRISVVPMREWNDENALETLLMVEDVGSATAAQAEASRALLADLPAIVWQADPETLHFRSVEGAAEELLGYPPAQWTSRPNFFEERVFFEERIYAEDRPAVMAAYRAAIANGGDASAEFRAVSADGALVWCRETIRVTPAGTGPHGVPGSITGVIANIERRRELERQILTASRTEALQTLAGRLAHDLNNPLMIVTGYTEEMLASFAPGDSRRADASQILSAAGRVSEATHQLIEFGRKHARPAAPVNLSQALKSLEARLGQAAGGAVTLEMIPPAADLWVSADQAQIAEVVLALAGAQESSRDRTRLTVSWYADMLTESIPSATLPPGRYACVTLHDNGRGLNPAQRAALFETVLPPKDSTASQEAVLSHAYQIVREWGGDIAVEGGPAANRRAGGNTYSIYLPYTEAPATAVDVPGKPVAVKDAAPPSEPLRETILVVDDEAGIRGLMRKILQRERYLVLEAGSAEDALTVALNHPGRIDLLLTDVLMPGLSGPELARRMCATAPDLKVLYMSGHVAPEDLPSGPRPQGFAFLPKPFTLGALVNKVRETLDS